MKLLRIVLLICLAICFNKIEGIAQAKDYFFVKELSYNVQCDSVYGCGFTIINKANGGFSILPIDSIMTITIVDYGFPRSYSAKARKINIEPQLFLSRGGKRMCEICGEFDLKRHINILDKECLFISQLRSFRPDIEFTNIEGLTMNSGFKADAVNLKITKEDKESIREVNLTEPGLYSYFRKEDLLLKNDYSYKIVATVIKYSIRRNDGSILSFDGQGKNKLTFEVK